MSHGILLNAVCFLAAAVLSVPVAKKLGFGAILGYLVAGVLIGPSALGLISNVEDILHFSEFGVVFLLFLIGLELEPKKLWQMRLPILGMGSAQVVSCLLFFCALGMLLGHGGALSAVAAMGFALSSTAMVVQLLEEKKLMHTVSGRSAFSILLFQDIAVIPMLALLPFLAANEAVSTGLSWLPALKIFGVLAAVIVLGRILLGKILRIIAALHVREVFTALALLLVTAMAALMQKLDLSMGLGAFLAGVLLADSEYRHALETDIEPFKGLLLGLFFISVGMSVQVAQVVESPLLILALVAGIFAVKFVLHYILAIGFAIPPGQRIFFALVLAQVGEFAFVLFGAAQQLGILDARYVGILVATAAISMLLTPVLVKGFDKLVAPRLEKKNVREADVIPEQDTPVIIAGFGRVGQIVGRLLFASGIKATVLDFEPEQIELLRRFGFKVYYGDATRLDLLEAAGAGKAKVLVVAIDEVESNLQLVDVARQHFPHLKIVARARNVSHLFELRSRGIQVLEREAFDGSLRLGRYVLEALGFQAHQAFSMAQRFRHHDIKFLEELYQNRSSESVRISKAKQAREDIEKLFSQEETKRREGSEGWSVYDR